MTPKHYVNGKTVHIQKMMGHAPLGQTRCGLMNVDQFKVDSKATPNCGRCLPRTYRQPLKRMTLEDRRYLLQRCRDTLDRVTSATTLTLALRRDVRAALVLLTQHGVKPKQENIT